MVTLINRYNRSRHKGTLDVMHAARKRVFVDMLRWEVPHDDKHERDAFDTDDAVYLVACDPATGEHWASARLLRTDRPHILGDVFPQLCDAAPPCGPDIREITRFCLAPRIGRAARLTARQHLVSALVEYALLTGLRSYTGVAELGWLSQILSAGWEVRPLGLPQWIDGKLLGALEIQITAHTLDQLHPDWRSGSVPARLVQFDLPCAA